MKDYVIKKVNDLALCYKTFIDREATEKDIEICMFNDNGTRYTIASFEYDEEYDYYVLAGCGDRLRSKKIDWEVFGFLVQKGYKILDKMID